MDVLIIYIIEKMKKCQLKSSIYIENSKILAGKVLILALKWFLKVIFKYDRFVFQPAPVLSTEDETYLHVNIELWEKTQQV
jgi:hypothetical protein